MKILYIAHERRAAEAAASALRGISQNVTLAWAQTPLAALGWIRDNRDAQAVIVDAETQKAGFNALLEQVRGLGVATPIAVIAPDHLEGLLAALKTRLNVVVDQERNKREILEARVKEIEEWSQQARQRLAEGQAQHDATLARTTRICTALQDRVLELEAALHTASEREAAQTAAVEQLAGRESELRAAMAEALAARAAVERALSDAEAAHQDAQRRGARELAAAHELHAILENQLTRETGARATLEQRLAAAEVSRRDADQKHAAEVASLTTRLGDRDAQHKASLTRTNRICTTLQERLLELEATIRSADERHAADRAATDRLALRETELGAALAEALAARSASEHRLSEAETAHEQAAIDLASAVDRCAALERQLTEQATARSVLDERLAAAENARQLTDQQHATQLASLTADLDDLQTRHDAVTTQNAAFERQVRDTSVALEHAHDRIAELTIASERLAVRETELAASLTDTVAARTAVEQRLADAEAAQQRAEQRAAADLTAAGERYAALEDRLNQEIEARTTLEDRLSAAETARQHADDRHVQEVGSLTTRLTDLQAQYDGAMERTAAVERQLTGARTELEQARHDWKADLAAAAEELARRETELGTALAEAVASRTAVEQRLADAEAAHQDAQQRAAADLTAAGERYAALENRLNQETEARTTLENRLSAAETARQHADDRHVQEVGSLTTRLTDLQAQYDGAMERTAAIERQLTDAAAALEQARHDWKADLAAAAEELARRETELSTALAEAVAARTAVEQRLADAEAAHQRADQQAASDLTAAAERYTALEDRLNQEIEGRTTLEGRLSAAETARQNAEDHHAQEVESLTARLADVQAQYDRAMEQIAAVERQLTDTAAALEQARHDWKADLTAAAERHADLEDRLVQAATMRAALEDRLAAVETDRQDAAQQHAMELAALSARLADLQAQHDAAVTASNLDIARLQEETGGLRRQLTAMRTQAAALRREAERVPGLQLQLAERQKEIRRQFERAPYGLCECTPDGAITRVNHSLTRLLGYRTSADLPRADLVATVFECPADLHWLLERVEPAGKAQSVDTTLKTRDRRRLFVRLHALATDGSVLLAVEDLTKLSALEQRFREAQRMEAVGRVASEVAVTCDALLRDVTQGGRLWLAGFESDPSLRQQGELLLGDVTRAAGLLRQFAVYGHKQITNLEPVSVPRVLHEMKPVLERVLGDTIVLLLPKTTHPFVVDVESERVERILVNVANYARERMPQGGRVRIQLATTIVDRQFLARHPKVRPGAHVLITISEMQGAIRPALPMQWPIAHAANEGATLSASDKPGMDLGPLGALISDLGGHLWMSVEPAGNVTLQIHLPKRTQDEVVEPAAPGSLANRGRRLARWFRH